MKLTVGQKMMDFTFDTINESDNSYLESIKGKNAVLYFLRYYGCRLCQYEMHEIQQAIDKFKERDIDIKVVLQSSKENLAKYLSERPVDYEVISDPEMKLYEMFELESVEKAEDMRDEKSLAAVRAAAKLGFQHGEYEGNELQLPALFIIDKEQHIVFSRYAKTIGDIPSVEEMLELVKDR